MFQHTPSAAVFGGRITPTTSLRCIYHLSSARDELEVHLTCWCSSKYTQDAEHSVQLDMYARPQSRSFKFLRTHTHRCTAREMDEAPINMRLLENFQQLLSVPMSFTLTFGSMKSLLAPNSLC